MSSDVIATVPKSQKLKWSVRQPGIESLSPLVTVPILELWAKLVKDPPHLKHVITLPCEIFGTLADGVIFLSSSVCTCA